MMNQYKNETAQIHAPQALIEKTKAAVREEEARIRREQTSQIPASAPQAAYMDYAAYQKKYSWRKWSYPLTAAAAVVILLSVSLAMKGVWTDRFRGNRTASDGAMPAAETPAADAGEMSGAAAGSVVEEMESADAEAGEMSGAVTDSMAEDMERPAGAVMDVAPAEVENSGGAMTEEAPDKMDDSESAAAEAPAADYTEEETQRDMMQDSGAEKKEMKPFRSAKGGYVEIEAVEEKPAFYDDPAAEDIVYEGLTFRVMEEEKGWTAYVETTDGTAYVISGTFEELDAFLKEGYGKLEKTAKTHSKIFKKFSLFCNLFQS